MRGVTAACRSPSRSSREAKKPSPRTQTAAASASAPRAPPYLTKAYDYTRDFLLSLESIKELRDPAIRAAMLALKDLEPVQPGSLFGHKHIKVRLCSPAAFLNCFLVARPADRLRGPAGSVRQPRTGVHCPCCGVRTAGCGCAPVSSGVIFVEANERTLEPIRPHAGGSTRTQSNGWSAGTDWQSEGDSVEERDGPKQGSVSACTARCADTVTSGALAARCQPDSKASYTWGARPTSLERHVSDEAEPYSDGPVAYSFESPYKTSFIQEVQIPNGSNPTLYRFAHLFMRQALHSMQQCSLSSWALVPSFAAIAKDDAGKVHVLPIVDLGTPLRALGWAAREAEMESGKETTVNLVLFLQNILKSEVNACAAGVGDGVLHWTAGQDMQAEAHRVALHQHQDECARRPVGSAIFDARQSKAAGPLDVLRGQGQAEAQNESPSPARKSLARNPLEHPAPRHYTSAARRVARPRHGDADARIYNSSHRVP
ncbi:uncharacterized protein LOC34623012 [Cyclospora cayetanensis]|uniref:Uncharacterized protein LOC34623012 n=1 Tax=Cyclospora cayetanensis TaxID=88456 RepID=A0A6P6RU24_9EIME|nr:uncharacterized protein LOC34623012 [Cyclospora cayetanensis]